MKQFTLFILLAIAASACKKDNPTRYYNTYDVSFTVQSDIDTARISHTNTAQDIVSGPIYKPGFTYAYKALESGKKLFVQVDINPGDTGNCTIVFRNKEEVLQSQSFYLDSATLSCKSEFILK